jgi:hypothetical protein
MIDLKGKNIYVLTNVEMEWDCVCGVYLANSEDEVIEYLGDDYNDEVDVISESRLTVIKSKSEIRDEKIDQIIDK